MIDREAIYAATFNLIDSQKATLGIKTTSRHLQHIEDVDPTNMPAFFQVQVDEGVMQVPNVPPKFTLYAEWWLYVAHPLPGDQNAQAPSQIFNPLVDAMQQAIGMPPASGGAPQTLDGLVHAIMMNGKVKYADGSLGDRSIVMLPLAIIVA